MFYLQLLINLNNYKKLLKHYICFINIIKYENFLMLI